MSSVSPRCRSYSCTDETGVRPHRAENIPVLCLAAAIVLLACAAPAEAHTGTGLPGGFVSGFLHPLSGWDHLLAMVSVGLWGAILRRPLLIALPVIFPGMMVVGAVLGIAHVPLPRTEVGIAASVLVLGVVIALQYKAPVWLACTVVAVFAVFHGYAHGRELPSAADPVGYSVGFVLSTGLLHVCGIGVGLLNDVDRGRFKGRYLIRGLGAAIGLMGCVFLWQALV